MRGNALTQGPWCTSAASPWRSDIQRRVTSRPPDVRNRGLPKLRRWRGSGARRRPSERGPRKAPEGRRPGSWRSIRRVCRTWGRCPGRGSHLRAEVGAQGSVSAPPRPSFAGKATLAGPADWPGTLEIGFLADFDTRDSRRRASRGPPRSTPPRSPRERRSHHGAQRLRVEGLVCACLVHLVCSA